MIFKTIKCLTVLICLLSSLSIYSYDFSAGVGNLSEFIGKIQTDDKGTLNLISFNPYLKIAADFNIYENFFITPELGMTIPKSGEDSSTNRMSFYAIGNGLYKKKSFHLKLGAGFFLTRVSGSGGEETLNNGTSTTAFPLPDHAVYSRNFIVNVSTEYQFYGNFAGEIHTFIFNLLNKEDRAYSLGFNVNYRFGEIF